MNDDADLLTWRGPFRWLPRPLDLPTVRTISTAAFVLFLLAGIATMPAALGWTELRDANRTNLTIIFVTAMLSAFPVLIGRYASRSTMEWFLPTAAFFGFALSIVLISWTMYSVGPTFGGVAVYSVEVLVLSFFFLKSRWAIVLTGLTVCGYAVVLQALQDPPSPTQQLINIVCASVATGVLMGGLASRLDATSTALALLNKRLRRFLAPQVADALTANEDQLAPHKRNIAVFFVDLRGFTAFTNGVSADRVVDVLAEYYAAVGSIVHRYNGTIGGFDGDGVFAFLGDPVPNENAAVDALAMAKEIATELDTHTKEWGLGYGIGVAYGEATIGLVGFEGRLDYTPVGACVNLAARLCSDAVSGEIVIDDALKRAAGLRGTKKRPDVDLKGFGATKTYAVSH